MGKKTYHRISRYTPSLFQGALAFSGARSLSLSHEHPFEPLVRSVLLAALIALACLYLYCITSTVLNVIARKDTLAKTARLQGSIGSLEQRYLALSKEVNPGIAQAVGLAPLTDASYVYRPGAVGVATIEPNAI